MKTWTKYQALTHALLLILLLVDFSQSLSVLVYGDLLSPTLKSIYADQLNFWMIILYGLPLIGSFPIIALVIKLNHNQLQKLNMDRFYVVMLITSGLIVLYSFPYNCFAVIALIYAVYTLFGNKVKFAVFDPNALRMILLIAGVFAGITICITGFVDAIKIGLPNTEQPLRRFLLESIPISIYEEAVYRGMLYMFLMDLGLSKSKAFYIQAFLFWASHINYLLANPFFFWVVLPILSLTYGYIAMRSKSLTPSTFAHILYNTLVFFTSK